MRKIIILFSKILKRMACSLERLVQTKSVHDDEVRTASSQHDMARHPDEPFYAQEYLYWINKSVGESLKDLMVLDLGCGQGRLTIPIAQSCKHATGVDFTLQAIESARKYSRQSGCGNLDFVHSDILEFAKGRADGIFDIVVFTEVTFFLPAYKDVLKEIYRILKPKGTAFISFRSQFFNILYSVQRRKWDSAQTAIDEREGYLWGGHTWFSWHTQEDIQILLKQIGYSEIDCVGVGVCSGIEGDPLASIARPSLLGSKDKEDLQKLEISLSKEYVNNGRYILAMAKK